MGENTYMFQYEDFLTSSSERTTGIQLFTNKFNKSKLMDLRIYFKS